MTDTRIAPPGAKRSQHSIALERVEKAQAAKDEAVQAVIDEWCLLTVARRTAYDPAVVDGQDLYDKLSALMGADQALTAALQERKELS